MTTKCLCIPLTIPDADRAALSTEVDRNDAQKVEDAPKPIVKIDNQHDPFATVVSIQYGNRLGELLDTVCNFTWHSHMCLMRFLVKSLCLPSFWVSAHIATATMVLGPALSFCLLLSHV